MEHAQRDKKNIGSKEEQNSLNPYFNGTCSKSTRNGEITSNK